MFTFKDELKSLNARYPRRPGHIPRSLGTQDLLKLRRTPNGSTRNQNENEENNATPGNKDKNNVAGTRIQLSMKHFIVLEVLGIGGQATVMRAKMREGSVASLMIPSTELALKCYEKKAMGNRARHFLSREIFIHRSLQHTHIVALYEVFEDRKGVYLVLERVRGPTLSTVLQEEKHGLSERCALKLVAQVLEALCYMHALGYAHRDIKPGNMIFVEKPRFQNSTVGTLKLVDLGMAFAQAPNTPDSGGHSSEKCGSPGFAAPEVLARETYLPEMSDVWSTGVLLYVLISLSLPYKGKTPQDTLHLIRHGSASFDGEEWKDVSHDTRHIIMSMMSRDSKHRPKASACLHEVNRILGRLL